LRFWGLILAFWGQGQQMLKLRRWGLI